MDGATYERREYRYWKIFWKSKKQLFMLLLGKTNQSANSLPHKATVAPLPASDFCLALGPARNLCPLRGVGLRG